MNDQNLLKGVLLIAIALAFGLQSLFNYRIGEFSRAGPGLFPFVVSVILFLLGLAAVTRSRFRERVPMQFKFKNIALILASLFGFALLSEHVNMIVGIVFMVFCASFAGTSYSVVRNLKISVGLVLVAVAFVKLLGLQLPLL